MPVDLRKPEKAQSRKKYLVPVVYCAVVAMALWSGSAMVGNMSLSNNNASYSNLASGQSAFGIEPAAGDESVEMPKVNESDLKDVPVVEELPVATKDAKELPPIRISPDKPEVIKLDRDAVNVLVGSEDTLRAVPDTNRTIVLIPKKPGATYFKATDAEGKIIMQRHVIVGAIDKGNKYLRIRRTCASDDKTCKQYSVYYCPDMCHEVNVIQGESLGQTSATPDVAPAVENSNQTEYVEPAQPTPAP